MTEQEPKEERIPDLKKKWLHSHVGVPRLGHLALHQVTIPVKEDFVLEDQDGKTYHSETFRGFISILRRELNIEDDNVSTQDVLPPPPPPHRQNEVVWSRGRGRPELGAAEQD